MVKSKLYHWVRVVVGIICSLVFLSWSTSSFSADKEGALIDKISFEKESSNREKVIFKLNGPHIPKIFATKGETPKVVFDFYDTRQSPAIQSVIKSGGALISSIRVGMHQDPQLKTRVVLDLVPSGDYDFAQDFRAEDNSLVITVFYAGQKEKKQTDVSSSGGKADKISPSSVKAPSAPKVKNGTTSEQQAPVKKTDQSPSGTDRESVVKKSEPSSSQLVIKNISFEQGAEKGEKIVFQLTHFHPPVIFGIEEGTPSVICDFLDASVESSIPQSIPVQGQFVNRIRVESIEKSHKVRVVLELVPNHHYDLQQIHFKEENLYVLLVKSDGSKGVGNGSKP
jgi:hypothetical protein